ncbi:MAG: FtsX-like permease family protein [Bacteroidota bacterium]
MNLIRIAWKHIIAKPSATLMSLLLFGLGVGLISMLLLLTTQLQDKFERNLGNIDLVIGAKGSPLQLILCSIYQIDNPTGNIGVGEAKAFLNPKHPLIIKAIPLGIGDNFREYRIVGTTPEYLDVYQAELLEGNIWKEDFEATIGATVARDLGLKIGDTFFSSHGFNADDMEHDEFQFVVKSILKPSGTVIDKLILTNLSSIWKSHHTEGHVHYEESVNSIDSLLQEKYFEEELTSILVFYKNKTDYRSLNLLRGINENTGMMAASPAYRTARLFEMMGSATFALRMLAIAIVIVSAVSVFLSLYGSLRERRYELAIMRVMGSSRTRLFFLLIIEGVFLSLIGFVFGILLSHLGMEVLARYMESSYQYDFSGFIFLKEELFLLAGALIIGFLSAAIPAAFAAGTEISGTLGQK